MYRSLLVPLDGSRTAEHALPWALSIAQQDGVALNLVRVHVPPAPIMIGSEVAADVGLDRTIRHSESEYLDKLAAQLRAVSTIPIQHALLDGAISEAIDDYAASVGADLIVLTSHGHSAFVRLWLGSVADRIIRHSRTPVLLVRANDEQAADLMTRPFIHRIVVAVDGSELAERIVEPAVKLGRATGAEYVMLLVLESPDDKPPIPGLWSPDAARAKADAYLQKIARRLKSDALLVKTEVIQAPAAASAILDFVRHHGNPVVALATHGRSGVKRLILGSVADKIIRGAAMPVLIYHPTEPT